MAFTFKQLACYVQYEALDVYEQHSPRVLGITTTSQATLQAVIAHHGTVPTNSDLVPISVIKFLQQLIITTANILPTINAPIVIDPVQEFFRVLELEFSVKSSEFFCIVRHFISVER
jgi:hypothetical protein